MRTKFLKLFLFPLMLAFFVPVLCLADGPQVVSVTTDTATVSSGGGLYLSWIINGSSSGYNLYFYCLPGVKIKNYETGGEIPCETRYTTGRNVPRIGLVLTNISGNTVSLPVRVYPKDLYGTDYDSGAMTGYITVNPVAQLITDFTATTTSAITMGQVATSTITLTWVSSSDLSSTNLQFTCNPDVKIYQPNDLLPLPCGTRALTSNLSGSGSATFNFINSSFSETSVIAMVLPLISTNSYSAVQTKSVTLKIAGRTLPKPISVNAFTVPKTTITSGDGLNFAWDVSNAAGVNLQILCNSAVTLRDAQSTTTATIIPCGTPAFSQSLPPVSNTTLYFTNKYSDRQNITVYLIPQNADGTYNAMLNKQINVRIDSASQSVISPTPAISANPVPAPTATANTAGAGIKAIRTITFTQYLYKTSKASQVTALQKFLAQDKALYPEGLVTGYFGSLTETAVQRFQERYGIAKKGDDGYGYVGPKTRAKINSLDYF